LSRGWRERLDDQIDALVALRDGLDSCIGCGCLSLQRCAISNPGDTARTGGPGAAYLPAGLRREDSRLAGPVTGPDREPDGQPAAVDAGSGPARPGPVGQVAE
jgi:hypothetical protein